MSSYLGADTVAGKIIIAVVTALLVGGTAPWWWKEFFSGDSGPSPSEGDRIEYRDPSSTTREGSSGSGDVSEADGTSESEETSTSECILTISNELVSLRREPERLSPEVGRLEPGEYPTSEYRVSQHAGQEQGWFRIEAQGREGWIPNDTWTIASKTEACP